MSHHELATLLLLDTPIDIGAKPEIPRLEEAGLVKVVSQEPEAARFQLTARGNAILRGLFAP